MKSSHFEQHRETLISAFELVKTLRLIVTNVSLEKEDRSKTVFPANL